jgi:hypothetical protein
VAFVVLARCAGGVTGQNPVTFGSTKGVVMAARIGLTTGKEYVVQGTVDDTASSLIGRGDPFTVIDVVEDGETSKRVCVFQAHVAYVEEELERRSVYEERSIVGVE